MSEPIHTRGIVLRRIPYSETSVILTVFTEKLGLRKYLANGVRSARAKTKSALYQPMALLEMVVYHRDDRELNRLGEVRAAYVYRAVPFEVFKGAVGLFMAEVAQKTVREGDASPDFFGFLYEAFVLLDQWEGSVANLPIWYLVRLTAFLGIRPGGEQGPSAPIFDMREGVFVAEVPGHHAFLSAEESEVLGRLAAEGVAECMALPLKAPLRRGMLERLLQYYKMHLDYMAEVHAHLVLQEVLR
jgi:DNA repair protein RecO (recombination protein O)